jgi:hypothetical protein
MAASLLMSASACCSPLPRHLSHGRCSWRQAWRSARDLVGEDAEELLRELRQVRFERVHGEVLPPDVAEEQDLPEERGDVRGRLRLRQAVFADGEKGAALLGPLDEPAQRGAYLARRVVRRVGLLGCAAHSSPRDRRMSGAGFIIPEIGPTGQEQRLAS